MTAEHVFLVAVSVTTDEGREVAERHVHEQLNRGRSDANLKFAERGGFPFVDSWWIAEDERHDGSDCDSAVFVPNYSQPGGLTQAEATAILEDADKSKRAGVDQSIIRAAAVAYLQGDDYFDTAQLRALAKALGDSQEG